MLFIYFFGTKFLSPLFFKDIIKVIVNVLRRHLDIEALLQWP